MRQRSPAWLQGPEVALSRRHILYRFVISRRSSGRVLRATRLVERWQVEGSCPAPRVRQSRRRISLWYVWPICEPDPPVLSLLSLSWLWFIDVSMRSEAQLSCRTAKLPLTHDSLPHIPSLNGKRLPTMITRVHFLPSTSLNRCRLCSG